MFGLKMPHIVTGSPESVLDSSEWQKDCQSVNGNEMPAEDLVSSSLLKKVTVPSSNLGLLGKLLLGRGTVPFFNRLLGQQLFQVCVTHGFVEGHTQSPGAVGLLRNVNDPDFHRG